MEIKNRKQVSVTDASQEISGAFRMTDCETVGKETLLREKRIAAAADAILEENIEAFLELAK